MSVEIVYDKDGKKVPSREFLSMIIILLRRCGVEAEMSLMSFLEQFASQKSIDLHNDCELRKAIHKYLDDNYPEKAQP